MKPLLILLTLLCVACERHKPVVMQKFYSQDMPCICKYSLDYGDQWMTTEDSCHLYQVGDTIK